MYISRKEEKFLTASLPEYESLEPNEKAKSEMNTSMFILSAMREKARSLGSAEDQ